MNENEYAVLEKRIAELEAKNARLQNALNRESDEAEHLRKQLRMADYATRIQKVTAQTAVAEAWNIIDELDTQNHDLRSRINLYRDAVINALQHTRQQMAKFFEETQPEFAKYQDLINRDELPVLAATCIQLLMSFQSFMGKHLPVGAELTITFAEIDNAPEQALLKLIDCQRLLGGQMVSSQMLTAAMAYSRHPIALCDEIHRRLVYGDDISKRIRQFSREWIAEHITNGDKNVSHQRLIDGLILAQKHRDSGKSQQAFALEINTTPRNLRKFESWYNNLKAMAYKRPDLPSPLNKLKDRYMAISIDNE